MTLYTVTHFRRYMHHIADVGPVADVYGYRCGSENRSPILIATVPASQMPKVGTWDPDATDGAFDGDDIS